MYDVIWYDGPQEYRGTFPTREAALSFIADTGVDPDEFDIFDTVESDNA